MNVKQHPRSFKHRLWRHVRILILVYVTTAVGCAAFQQRMLYYPTTGAPAAMDRLGGSRELERWKNAAGQNIGWKRISRSPPSRGEVLITHGNGGCAADRVVFAKPLTESLAMDVFIL